MDGMRVTLRGLAVAVGVALAVCLSCGTRVESSARPPRPRPEEKFGVERGDAGDAGRDDGGGQQSMLPGETEIDGGAEEQAAVMKRYRTELITWFNKRWDVREFEKLPCKVVRQLRARVEIEQEHRRITRVRILDRSGQADLDDSLQRSLAALIGQELPPPPKGQGDALGAKVYTIYSGQTAPCVNQ